MTVEKGAAKKSRAHTIYKKKSGLRVPGVTSITGVMDKPALVKWANNLGLQGIDSAKYVDELATIGKLAHEIIEKYLKKETMDYADYTPNQISLAENGAIKYFEWEKKQELKTIGSEMKLVSEKHSFGGTCDLYAELNGKKTLIDLKTGKGIYGDMFTQVAGYKILLEENGYPVEDVMILRIGRSEDEGFETKTAVAINLHVQRFFTCLKLYNLNKEIRRAT